MYYFGAASIVTVTTAGLLYAYGTCCRRNRKTQPSHAEYSIAENSHQDLHSMIGDGIEVQLSNQVAPLYSVLQETLNYLTVDKLRIDGIFRESGNLIRSKELYTTMTLRRAVQHESEHDVISALKLALNDHLKKGLFNGRKLHTEMMTCKGNSHSPDDMALVFKQHIQCLINQNMQNNAAIIHDLLHLGYLIQREQSFNRMTTDNVAKILAPHFMKICDIPDPQSGQEFEYMRAQDSTKLILKDLITHSYFSKPFEVCLLQASHTHRRRAP